MTTTVVNQQELDAATKAGVTHIIINSPAGVWLTVRTPGSSHVEAWESSHVVARGSSHVVAWESSHVEAWGSSHVEAAAYVAVHLHSARATVEGGHLIDVSALNLADVDTWQAFTGYTMLLADDGRGYRLGTRAGRYTAGCRDFTADEAIAHWSNPEHPAPASAALLLAAVQAHVSGLVVTS